MDSLIFPAVAFGWPLLLPVVVGQFVAKVFGGGRSGHGVIIQFGANGNGRFPWTNHETPSRQRPPRPAGPQRDVAQVAKVIAVQEAQIAALQAENERLIRKTRR